MSVSSVSIPESWRDAVFCRSPDLHMPGYCSMLKKPHKNPQKNHSGTILLSVRCCVSGPWAEHILRELGRAEYRSRSGPTTASVSMYLWGCRAMQAVSVQHRDPSMIGKASTDFIMGQNNLLKMISPSDCNIFAVIGRGRGKGNNFHHLVSPPVAAAPDPWAMQK